MRDEFITFRPGILNWSKLNSMLQRALRWFDKTRTELISIKQRWLQEHYSNNLWNHKLGNKQGSNYNNCFFNLIRSRIVEMNPHNLSRCTWAASMGKLFYRTSLLHLDIDSKVMRIKLFLPLEKLFVKITSSKHEWIKVTLNTMEQKRTLDWR